MSRGTKTSRSTKGSAHFPRTYEKFANGFVELLLHPANGWLRQYFFCNGFTSPIGSIPELALDILAATQSEFLVRQDVFEGVQNKDKEFLIEYVKRNLARTRPKEDSLFSLLNALESRRLRKEVRALTTIFQTHRGPKPKISREEYGELLSTADTLAPLIEKLLKFSQNTQRTLDEMLTFWEKDHPEGSKFLRRNKLPFEKASADRQLLVRAKSLPKRAQVLADALAGSEFKLSLRTSLDIVRAQRKLIKNAPQIAD